MMWQIEPERVELQAVESWFVAEQSISPAEHTSLLKQQGGRVCNEEGWC